MMLVDQLWYEVINLLDTGDVISEHVTDYVHVQNISCEISLGWMLQNTFDDKST